MIDVNNLSKSFDGYKALEEANIHVGSGNIYGLVGPNGAGKSTIIRHILGVYKGDSGEVLVGGEPVWENPKVKARIASIPDDLFYYTQASVSDMMHIYKGIYPNFSTLRYEKLKEAFDIDEKRMIRTLSKGMQKQVAFWLALSTMPDYLVLDEPVDGLDPVMRRRVWSLMMNDVTERGTTVLVSSHNLRELEDVCDHVGIMDKGRVICERSLSELQENMVKMQVVFKEGFTELPPELNVISSTNIGRVHTLIMRANALQAKELLSACDPILVDALPLTLEEIFIYELGGDDSNVKDFII